MFSFTHFLYCIKHALFLHCIFFLTFVENHMWYCVSHKDSKLFYLLQKHQQPSVKILVAPGRNGLTLKTPLQALMAESSKT